MQHHAIMDPCSIEHLGKQPQPGWYNNQYRTAAFQPADEPIPGQRNASQVQKGSESEAMLWYSQGNSCVSLPRLCFPLYAAAHKVCIHTRHRDTHTLPLKLAAVVTGVAIPAERQQTAAHSQNETTVIVHIDAHMHTGQLIASVDARLTAVQLWNAAEPELLKSCSTGCFQVAAQPGQRGNLIVSEPRSGNF